ncbi:MAG: hypothetical protein QGG42_12285 [Phycisphaerae bacterium]|jgi:hypothetical protein|nr:hypothetical protein [Phycisphaerae bacterium]
MRTLSRVVIFIGLCLGVFSLAGLHSQREFGEFLGLNVIFLQINLLMGIFILASGLAIMLYAMVQDRVIERAARQDADTADGNPPIEDIPLCYSCLTPAKPHQHFCMNCWTPLTSHAEIDPLGRIYAMGDMYWKLTRGPSKPIAMAGLWLIVGLPLVIHLVLIVALALTSSYDQSYSLLTELFTTSGGIAVFLVGPLYLAYLAVQGMILVKAIRNRRRDPQEQLYSEEPQETQTEPDPDDRDMGAIGNLGVIEDDKKIEASQSSDDEYGWGSMLLLFVGSYSTTLLFVLIMSFALGSELLARHVVFFPAGMFGFFELGRDVAVPATLIGYAVYLVLIVIGVLCREMAVFWIFLCALLVNLLGCLVGMLFYPG